MIPRSLTYKKQLSLFMSRGLACKREDVSHIQHIGYYKLKEFASPFSKIDMSTGHPQLIYQNITFAEVLERYYQDKNLRIFLFHAIESIEVSVKNNLSNLLGKKYGPFGYLSFAKWSNKSKFTKFTVISEELRYKKKFLVEFKGIEGRYGEDDFTSDGFPTVWIGVASLMMGDLIRLIELLNEPAIRKLASIYKCTAEEFLSWIKCLQFIRNICAHNANLIDIQIQTKPKVRDVWKPLLTQIISQDSQGNLICKPTNRMAVLLFIVIHFMETIDSSYNWQAVQKSIRNLCLTHHSRAQMLGFSSYVYAHHLVRYIRKSEKK